MMLPRLPMKIAAAVAGVAILAAGAALATGVFSSPEASAAAEAAAQGPPPAPVRVAEAVMAELAPHSEAPGAVVSVADSEVAAATSGKILWIADVGAKVSAGDVIARIDPADAILMRDESRADVARLSSRAQYLARLLQRFEGLGEDAGESEASIDQMRADRDEAAQNLARAQVALRRAETEFERTEVKAPFAGRLAARAIEVGEYASPGAPIARLVDIDHLEVTARASDSLLASVRPGGEVEVRNGAESLRARVRAIVPIGDAVSRTLELRLVLPKTDWHIGSAVQVSLPRSAPRRVIAANRDALILRADRVSVFRIDADNTAKQVDVELGAADGELIEIIGEVEEGDRLVIRGGERLRDGQPVVIQQADAGAVS